MTVTLPGFADTGALRGWLSAFFQDAPLNVYLKDTEGRLVWVNRAYEKVFDVDNNDLELGNGGGDPIERVPGALAHDREVLETGKSVERQEEFSGRIYRVVKCPVFDETRDKIIGVIGFDIDITKEVDTQRELEKLLAARTNEVEGGKQRLGEARSMILLRDRAIAALDVGILVTDARQEDNPIIYVNPAIERMTGFDADEMIGRNPRFLQGEDHNQPELEQIRTALREKEPVSVMLRNYRKDGSQFLDEVQISPVRDANGIVTHFIGVQNDVTERVATEAQLRHAQKMDAIGELTGGVAHDFNNLLTVVLGNLEMLESRIGTDAQSATLVREAMEVSEMGAQLTGQLLAFSRQQPLEDEVVDLNDLISNMIDLLRRSLGETIDIRTALFDDLHRTMADSSQLQNALLNLSINARDAMPKGGSLTIETANREFAYDSTTAHAEITAGEYAVLSVRDTGTGIAPENLERIFEPFFTTKAVGKGTGLGLSMVYGFAQQSGGQLEVSSELGLGTVFSLYLPRYAGDTLVKNKRSTAPVSLQPVKETVLVVEDDARVRRVTVSRFETLGYTVLEAEDGKTALELLADTPVIDLLFTDLIMPGGMSGEDLVKEVRRVRPEMKVMYTSGYTGQDGIQPVGGPLLSKPYKMAELGQKVRELLDGC